MLNNDFDGNLQLTLIDFGYAKSFLDEEGSVID
jgi:hypothetical protein